MNHNIPHRSFFFALAAVALLPLAALAAQPASGPTVSTVSRMAIEGEPFAGLDQSAPLLAGLLLSAVHRDSDQHVYLVLTPFLSGTIASPEGNYKHHDSFSPRPNGEVSFIFDLDSLKDHSSITYTGIIRDHGRNVEFSKSTHPAPGVKGTRVRGQWTAPN
jgi:hypothetical protein